MIRAAWREKKWKDATPVRLGQRRVIRYHRRCLLRRGDQDVILFMWRKQKREFRIHRKYRKVTPYRGFSGQGYWLKWLATPAWVVYEETEECGSDETCRWSIVNEIGACGPYQLNGWGHCAWRSWKDKLRHHQIAHSLPRGSWAVGW